MAHATQSRKWDVEITIGGSEVAKWAAQTTAHFPPRGRLAELAPGVYPVSVTAPVYRDIDRAEDKLDAPYLGDAEVVCQFSDAIFAEGGQGSLDAVRDACAALSTVFPNPSQIEIRVKRRPRRGL